MKKIITIIILIFSFIIGYNIFKTNEYDVSYKKYYVNQRSEDETKLNERVQKIYNEYKKNGSILKPNYLGAVYSTTYDASGLSFSYYTDDIIRQLFKYMNSDPNVGDDGVIVYNEQAFKENLKKFWFTSERLNKKDLSEEKKQELVDSVFEFNDFYYNLYYGGETESSGVCGSFSGLMVNVLDAKSGNIQKTLSLDEYILGVAYGEEDAHIDSNQEFGKSFFISAITFTLNMAGYNKNKDLKEFSIENSTNNQVWCDVTTGCGNYGGGNSLYPDSKGSYKKKLSEERLAKYREIYNSIAGNVLKDKSGSLTNIHYVADMPTCNSTGWCKYGQNTMITQEAYNYGKSGATYKEIIGKYFSSAIIENIGGSSTCSMSGWTIRETAPTRAISYYNIANYYGECVWYVRGRGQEIAAELMQKGMIDQSTGNTIIQRLEGVGGNAVDWLNSAKGKFNESTNYKDYKAGSVIVYSGGVNRCGGPCGHVAVIENVDQANKTITYTEGGQSFKSNGYFSTRKFTFDEFEAYITGKTGSSLRFSGYIYFLEPTK